MPFYHSVSQSTAVEKNPEGAPKGNGNARTHGLNTLKDAVTKLGSRALDGRSSLSYALTKWRRELIVISAALITFQRNKAPC